MVWANVQQNIESYRIKRVRKGRGYTLARSRLSTAFMPNTVLQPTPELDGPPSTCRFQHRHDVLGALGVARLEVVRLVGNHAFEPRGPASDAKMP
jgi:hypothetical protein